jgi:hypothetical protein
MKRILADMARIPTSTGDPVIDAKKQMIDSICSKLGDVNTFLSISKVIGYGRDFVSRRLIAKFKKDPTIMYRIGNDYRVPRVTAARLIRELYAY